ncbi:MAG: hypothetical protein U1E86_28575 [Burkholderiaceae bacterium]
MTDEKALQLITGRPRRRRERAKAHVNLDQFAKILPGWMVSALLQLENKIDAAALRASRSRSRWSRRSRRSVIEAGAGARCAAPAVFTAGAAERSLGRRPGDVPTRCASTSAC